MIMSLTILKGIVLTSVLVLLFSAPALAASFTTAFEDDGMVTVNGQRTLIIGSYYPGKSESPYKELKDAGFNLVCANPEGALDKAQEAGLMTWVTVGALDPDPAKREASEKTLIAAIDKVKDHPSVALLETVDEPAWTWMKKEQRVSAAILAETFKVIKAHDANHLIYTNQAPTNLIKTLQQYNAGTDIQACDIYPVNPGGVKPMFALFPDGNQGDLNNEQISQVGEYADKMRKVAGPNRPVFMVLQAFAWETLKDEVGMEEVREEKVLLPSYAQSRFMAFNSLIHGANGVVYWGSFTLPVNSQCWTDIKRVTREVSDLAQPLATRTVKDFKLDIDYVEMGHSVDDGVQWIVKAHGGKKYLFTCNADKNACKATLSGLKDVKTCTVFNENRTLPIENGSITDSWRRFDVHVYVLE